MRRGGAGVPGVTGSALIEFQLSDPDPDLARRTTVVAASAADPQPEHLDPLRAALAGEPDPALLSRAEQVPALLAARCAPDTVDRVAALRALSADIPAAANVAARLTPGSATPPRVTADTIHAALAALVYWSDHAEPETEVTTAATPHLPPSASASDFTSSRK